MYTVSKGPSKIVAKTRRGLSGNLDRLERREAARRLEDSETTETDMPRPVFHSNGKKTVHQRIHHEVITPQHEEVVRFIHETWIQTACCDSEPSSPTSTVGEAVGNYTNGSGSSSPAPPTALYYRDEPPSPALRDFKPFDLETWWGKRLYQNITSSL